MFVSCGQDNLCQSSMTIGRFFYLVNFSEFYRFLETKKYLDRFSLFFLIQNFQKQKRLKLRQSEGRES